jgi:hypothetical protein
MTSKQSSFADTDNLLWSLTDEIYDYFGRMGGSGQYGGFRYWHIPAFILLKTYKMEPEILLSYQVSEMISPRLGEILDINLKKQLKELETKTISTDNAISYAVYIVSKLEKCKEWIDEIDELINFLSKIDIKIPIEFLPEIVRYNGRRIKIIENLKNGQCFGNSEYPISIVDKKINADVGSAKKIESGVYEGYIVCGMHELHIDGKNIRELAKSAYREILVAEKY